MTLDEAASALDVSKGRVKILARTGQLGNSRFISADGKENINRGVAGTWKIDGRAVRRRLGGARSKRGTQ